jgi:hypothetical protein
MGVPVFVRFLRRFFVFQHLPSLIRFSFSSLVLFKKRGMFHGQSISRNLIAGVAITVGSAGSAAAYQQTTTAPTSEQPRTTDSAISDPLRTEQASSLPAFPR